MSHLAISYSTSIQRLALLIKLPPLIDLLHNYACVSWGTVYCNGGPIMTDTNGPGGPVMTTPLVRGDHLCRGTI